jgi:signal peptidase I
MHKDELDIAALGLSEPLANALRLGLAADHHNRPQRMTQFQALLLGGSEAGAAKQVKSEPKTVDLPTPSTIDVNIKASFDPDTNRSQLSEKTWRGVTSAVILVAVCFFSIFTPALSLLFYIVFVLVGTAKKALKKRDGASVDSTKRWWGPTWVLSSIIAGFFTHSFLVAPSKISGGGMAPTLLAGDFILVNKFTYGIRLPVINKKIVDVTPPQRGDVTVFRYPPDPSLDRIGRVVGLPGDKLVYRNKLLTINGQEMPQTKAEDYLDRDRLFYTPRFIETLAGVAHDILIEPEAPPFIRQITRFPHDEKCHYDSEGVSCEVPAGHYFMMGDNRDNSQDSRYWGFVPDANLAGKIFLVWMNFDKSGRFGTSIK